MKRDPDFYIIMTLVAVLVILGILIAHPVQGARSCLTRAEAARTWPTKQLAIDDDGCHTYYRRGVKPAPEPPVLISPPTNEAEEINTTPDTTPDLVDRWPSVVEIEGRPPAYVDTRPWVTARNVAAIVAVVVLSCAVFEVAFGGIIARWRKSNGNT